MGNRACPYAYKGWMSNKYAAMMFRPEDTLEHCQERSIRNILRICPCLEDACQAYDSTELECKLMKGDS